MLEDAVDKSRISDVVVVIEQHDWCSVQGWYEQVGLSNKSVKQNKVQQEQATGHRYARTGAAARRGAVVHKPRPLGV